METVNVDNLETVGCMVDLLRPSKVTTCLLHDVPVAGITFGALAGNWNKVIPDQEQVEGLPVELKHEPGNQHDPQAVAVYLNNHHVGYIPRSVNGRLAGYTDQQLQAKIKRLICEEEPYRRSIWLDISVEELL